MEMEAPPGAPQQVKHMGFAQAALAEQLLSLD